MRDSTRRRPPADDDDAAAAVASAAAPSAGLTADAGRFGAGAGVTRSLRRFHTFADEDEAAVRGLNPVNGVEVFHWRHLCPVVRDVE